MRSTTKRVRLSSAVFWISLAAAAVALLLYVLGAVAATLLLPKVLESIGPPPRSLPLGSPTEIASIEEEAIIDALEEKNVVVLRADGPRSRPRSIVADSRHVKFTLDDAIAISKLKSLEEIQLRFHAS